MSELTSIRQLADGVEVTLWVTPNAPKNRVGEVRGGIPTLKINAPPVDGKANRIVIEFLSDLLDVPRSAIVLVHGEKGRKKTVRVECATPEAVRAIFLKATGLFLSGKMEGG